MFELETCGSCHKTYSAGMIHDCPKKFVIELTHDQWSTLLVILDETMGDNARTGYKENNPFIQRIKNKVLQAKTS